MILVLLPLLMVAAALQSPVVAAVSVGAFYLALRLRKTGDEPFAIAIRRPENKPKLKKWLIAYAVVCALGGTGLFLLFHPAGNPGLLFSSVMSPLYASVIVLHGSFFFGYLGWTGNKRSRWAYWLLGGVAVLGFASMSLVVLKSGGSNVTANGWAE